MIHGEMIQLVMSDAEFQKIELRAILSVGIVPSNYYCMLKTLTVFMNISFYISLCMCHEMIV